jgi:class I lanthipeptide synthase
MGGQLGVGAVPLSTTIRGGDAAFRRRARLRAIAIGDRLLREAGLERSDGGESSLFAHLSSRGLNGPSGFALLYGALGDLTGEERFTSAMHRYLREAALADDRPDLGLFNGISGLRAAAALAARAEPRYAKLVAQCDAFIDSELPSLPVRPLTYEGFDLIDGWSGARLARCVGRRGEDDRLVEFIVWVLEDSERWRCPHPLRPNDPAENDLGLAHGVSGMLAALSLTVERFEGPVAAAAAGAMRNLRNLGVDLGTHRVWPPMGWEGQPQSQEAYRSAWCYGAAGVIAALHTTAEALRDRETMAFASEAMHRLGAQPVESWSLENEALCHGLAGNALCFASVAAATGSPELLNVALRAATAAMDGLDANGGTCWAGEDSGRYDAVGFLNGVSGIGLALLTLSGDADSTWMRLIGLRPVS